MRATRGSESESKTWDAVDTKFLMKIILIFIHLQLLGGSLCLPVRSLFRSSSTVLCGCEHIVISNCMRM